MERRGGPMKYLAIGALAVCTVIAACDSPTLPPRSNTDVYDFRLQNDTFHIFHWPAGSRIGVYIHGSTPAKLDSLAKSFERGAAEWNKFALLGEYELVRATTLSEADVVLRWSNDVAPVDHSACPPVFSSGVTTFCIEDLDATPLRLATFPQAGTPDPTARGVKMLVTILASQATIPGRIDRLVAHELGHVLGIGRHSPEPSDLMFAEPARTTLSRRDVATVQVLYHTDADILP
jgi:hypothetical protein